MKGERRGERGTTLFSIFLFAGLYLLLFVISPFIDASLRLQFQFMQVALPVSAVIMVVAVEVGRRLKQASCKEFE
jgi:hypothetical protein